eukprot:3961011-Pyramimonas_sp.AAC.1
MFLHGGDVLNDVLLEGLNAILRAGLMEPAWRETFFVMLPKSGDRRGAKNWRPIAALRIGRINFASMTFERLRLILDAEQPEDQ